MIRRPVTTAVAVLALALCAGLGLVFLNAYRKGITIRLGEGGRPGLPPPPPTASALPDEQSQRYTNEQMHAMLQQETSQLGIQRFVPRGETEEEPTQGFLGPRLGGPGSRAQAESAIRELARLRRTVDAGKKKPVPLAGRVVPVLAAPESGGAAVEPEPRAPKAPRKPKAAEPAPQPQAIGPGAWSGLYGGVEEGTLTISDAKSWADLWGRLSRKPAPRLDFSRQQVVGVFLGPQPTGGFRVEISSAVTASPTAVVVSYRALSPAADRTPPEGATAPYALRAIERTDRPVRFEKSP
ncbi:MAG: protease complex subunit PrcB family protein [Elusimicrobia bacterium]|nr:protease complex subunit PrcB family protein [Elusimicrobiota bacterium]